MFKTGFNFTPRIIHGIFTSRASHLAIRWLWKRLQDRVWIICWGQHRWYDNQFPNSANPQVHITSCLWKQTRVTKILLFEVSQCCDKKGFQGYTYAWQSYKSSQLLGNVNQKVKQGKLAWIPKLSQEEVWLGQWRAWRWWESWIILSEAGAPRYYCWDSRSEIRKWLW